MKYWVLRIIGFTLGALAVLAVEMLILYSLNLNPRGATWLILPILAGVASSSMLAELWQSENSFIGRMKNKFWLTSSVNRLLIVLPLFWVFVVGVYVWIFSPYGGYMSSSEYFHMYKIMAFPPCMLLLCCFIYFKLINPKTNSESSEEEL